MRRFEDRSTAIRRLIDFALREMTKREALEAYRTGRVTLRERGRALGLDTWATQDLLAAEGVAVAQGAREETQDALCVAIARHAAGVAGAPDRGRPHPLVGVVRPRRNAASEGRGVRPPMDRVRHPTLGCGPRTPPGGHMIGIGILIATVPAIVMAIGAVIGTRLLLRMEMFHSKA